MRLLALLALLADPVYVCPDFPPGSTLPLPIPQGCVTPTHGVLYSGDHTQDIALLTQAYDDCKQANTEMSVVLDGYKNQWGPTTWLLIGIASGAILTYGGLELKTRLD